MSTHDLPVSVGSLPESPNVDAEFVTRLAREFWTELSGNAGTGIEPTTLTQSAQAQNTVLPAYPVAAETNAVPALVGAYAPLNPFSSDEPRSVLGHTVEVHELGSVFELPGSTRYPEFLPIALPNWQLPGNASHGDGSVPYYLQGGEVVERGQEPGDCRIPYEVAPVLIEPSVSIANTSKVFSVNPFGSVSPAIPDPRGGFASSPLGVGSVPEVLGGVAPKAVPGSLVHARQDFPILNETVNGKPLVWLDNAATTQKPQAVIDRLKYYYEHENSNIHRAAHTLAARSTDAYEAARSTVSRFINAGSADNIVFVRGATEGINLVAQAWGRKHIKAGDEIVITWLEHHANIVPWQQLAVETGAKLLVAPIDDRGQVLLHEYERLLGPRTKLVSIAQVSNALGTVVPVEEMVASAHRYGARVLVDGAQAISHMPVDVRRIDADFFVISGHKVFAPTGIGVLYGKPEVLESMPPWQGGGNMIADVTFERTLYNPPPSRFEAGTGNIADAVGLGAALEYLERIGMANVAIHEHDLIEYATKQLLTVSGLRIIGTAAEKAGVVSFVLANRSVPAVGAALASAGIAVRAGHHCAQPALRRFGLEATVRPSFALYNNYQDIDSLDSVVKELASGKVR
jgi:SufS family cysteine desulfurase